MNPSQLYNKKHEQFLSLYAKHHKRIFAFILSLVPRRVDAEDIMQLTSTALWEMFDRYEPGSDFVSWSMQVAKYRVLQFRKKQSQNQLRLKEAAFEAILDQAHAYIKDTDDRTRALEGCLQKLKAKDLEIVRLRYQCDMTIKHVAEHLDRPVMGMYKVLARIHAHLQVCIQRTLSAWEGV